MRQPCFNFNPYAFTLKSVLLQMHGIFLMILFFYKLLLQQFLMSCVNLNEESC